MAYAYERVLDLGCKTLSTGTKLNNKFSEQKQIQTETRHSCIFTLDRFVFRIKVFPVMDCFLCWDYFKYYRLLQTTACRICSLK